MYTVKKHYILTILFLISMTSCSNNGFHKDKSILSDIDKKTIKNYHRFNDIAKWLPIDTCSIDGYWVKRQKFPRQDTIYWNYGTTPGYISNADIETFVIGKDTYYAKDLNNVYFPIQVFDNIEEDVVWSPNSTSFATIIDGADPKTFKCIGEGFAVDKKHMYFFGEEIPWDNKFLDKGNREKYMKYREYSYW